MLIEIIGCLTKLFNLLRFGDGGLEKHLCGHAVPGAATAQAVENPMIFCAAGDIHGALDRLYAEVLAFEASLGVRFAQVLHVGDFGIWPDPDRIDRATRKHDGAGDFPRWFAEGRAAPRPTTFIKGNHEDFDWLEHLADDAVLPGLHYLRNGQTRLLPGGVVVAVSFARTPSAPPTPSALRLSSQPRWLRSLPARCDRRCTGHRARLDALDRHATLARCTSAATRTRRSGGAGGLTTSRRSGSVAPLVPMMEGAHPWQGYDGGFA